MNDKILLFFGSGISYLSGLPNTDEITNHIMRNKWHEHTDQNFYPGEHPSELYRKTDITKRIQKFLSILKEFSDPYFRQRRGNEANYEDLFYLCNQIYDNESMEIDNPLLVPFLYQLHNKLVGLDIYTKIPPKNKKIDIKYLSERSISLIQNVVWNLLSTQENPKGLDLILKIIDNFNFIKIATLNHDLLVERILDIHSINYCDGFGKPKGEIRYFEPDLYDKEEKVKLFKLHGSLNWYRFREEINNRTIDRYGMALKPDHWHLKDSNGHFVNTIDGTPLFLTGSYNKMLDYNFGIFKIIHNKFDNMLPNINTIIMSGYGWNDRGINGRLFQWLGSSFKNKIILLHENPEDLKRYSRSALWHKYDGLVKEKRLILIKKWFSDTKYSDIQEYVN